MRSLCGLIVGLICLATATGASAESRIFILATEPHGPVAACLIRQGPCGLEAAQSWCRSHHFSSATAYRRVDRDEITGEIPKSHHLCPAACADADFIAITCQR